MQVNNSCIVLFREPQQPVLLVIKAKFQVPPTNFPCPGPHFPSLHSKPAVLRGLLSAPLSLVIFKPTPQLLSHSSADPACQPKEVIPVRVAAAQEILSLKHLLWQPAPSSYISQKERHCSEGKLQTLDNMVARGQHLRVSPAAHRTCWARRATGTGCQSECVGFPTCLRNQTL